MPDLTGPTRTIRAGDTLTIGDARVIVLHGKARVKVLAPSDTHIQTSRRTSAPLISRSYCDIAPDAE